jgi:hypothetical protein
MFSLEIKALIKLKCLLIFFQPFLIVKILLKVKKKIPN